MSLLDGKKALTGGLVKALITEIFMEKKGLSYSQKIESVESIILERVFSNYKKIKREV